MKHSRYKASHSYILVSIVVAIIWSVAMIIHYYRSPQQITVAEPAVAAKADKLPAPASLLPKPVKVEVIKEAAVKKPEPAPAPFKEKDLLEPNQPQETMSKPKPVTEFCARNGGRKVTRNHGRSWRCVYGH